MRKIPHSKRRCPHQNVSKMWQSSPSLRYFVLSCSYLISTSSFLSLNWLTGLLQCVYILFCFSMYCTRFYWKKILLITDLYRVRPCPYYCTNFHWFLFSFYYTGVYRIHLTRLRWIAILQLLNLGLVASHKG